MVVAYSHVFLDILAAAIKWDVGIIVTDDDHSSHFVTSFLDLETSSVVDVALVYRTHRNKHNAYLYIPRISNHPYHMKNAIVSTELLRLLHTTMFKEDYDKQVICLR